eukprot:754287-Hanusia_phi.AAC.2
MNSVSIAPRPRSGYSATFQVSLTPDVLTPLFNKPQQQAAQILGISLTSLKSACRYLGISRWPYRRGLTRHVSPATDSRHSDVGSIQAYEDWVKAFMNASEDSSAARECHYLQAVTSAAHGIHEEREVISQDAEGSQNNNDQILSERVEIDEAWLSWFLNRTDLDTEDVSFLLRQANEKAPAFHECCLEQMELENF